MYELTRLSDQAPLGRVDFLPSWLVASGATDDQVRDLDWAGWPDQGYWPINAEAPTFDPATTVMTGDFASLEPDANARAWTAVYATRPLTPAEITALNPVPASISKRQFFEALAGAGIITTDEALAAMAGSIPAEMLAVIGALPAGQQFGAKMLIAGAMTFERSNPLVSAFMGALNMAPSVVDELWRSGAAL